MSFLANLYHKSVAENNKNILFWEEYLQNLKSLDLSVYSDKLKVPVLVPIGNRILFRGELKHTNEVTVALGADYFAKCSLKQAEVLRQHRIKGAESKLQTFCKEREYLEKQISLQQNVFESQGQEIVEVHTEDEDRTWRQQHRENVRQWKRQKVEKTEETAQDEITDEELWDRLDELELQEDLENELYKNNDEQSKENSRSFIVNEEIAVEDKQNRTGSQSDDVAEESISNKSHLDMMDMKSRQEFKKIDEVVKFTEQDSLKPAGKFELLQKVMDKQVELEEKLLELRNKDRSKNKTEQDLIAKLDEMDELEELQDEMDRIEDIIETENVSEQSEEETPSISQLSDMKRRVSFADEDDSETLELTFHHSDAEPNNDSYDPSKGIQKPSDVYEAFSILFSETRSILKKTRYQDKHIDIQTKIVQNQIELVDKEPTKQNRTIEVKDIVEKVHVDDNKLMENIEKRPVSLFKQRRQLKKL